MVTHAIDHGVPAMAAATVLSAASLASLSGKIICGLVADRVGAKRTLVTGLARHRPRGRGHHVHVSSATPASGRAAESERVVMLGSHHPGGRAIVAPR